jgi:uncharacterized protein
MSLKNSEEIKVRKKRGFAVMDPMLVRALARKGGVAAHRAGTAHEFNAEEARIAGRKGGIAAHATPRDAGPTESVGSDASGGEPQP